MVAQGAPRGLSARPPMPSLRRAGVPTGPSEPLGVLLLPRRLEDFDLAAHARDLLDIPRVVAVEPSRWRRRKLLGEDLAAVRHARRLRFPGKPRVLVLYDPHQYHLARLLAARHEAEVWYVRGATVDPARSEHETAELDLLDQMAGEIAVQTLVAGGGEDPRSDNEPIRRRMIELEIISSRPFLAGMRAMARRQANEG